VECCAASIAITASRYVPALVRFWMMVDRILMVPQNGVNDHGEDACNRWTCTAFDYVSILALFNCTVVFPWHEAQSFCYDLRAQRIEVNHSISPPIPA
jgi:hypothetical protein